MKTLRTQTYYPLSRGIGICFWQMWCLGPRNPVVVCFTSPLSSLTAISSPHLSCFQSPTHNLLQLAVVFKRYYQPTHNLPQFKGCFQALLPPNSHRRPHLGSNNGSGDIRDPVVAKRDLAALGHSCSAGGALDGGEGPHSPI